MSFRHHSKYHKVLLTIFSIFLLVFIFLCYKANRVEQVTFQGILPCADCPGIDTEITFIKKGTEQRTYAMKLVYQDRDVAPFTETGEWIIDRSADQTKQYYSLYDGDRLSGKYLILDSRTIKQVGLDGVPFDTNINFELKKK